MKVFNEISAGKRIDMPKKIFAVILAGFLTALVWTPEPATAIELSGDDQFVLDFIANGDGSTNLSNFPVAVYWKWDGAQTLGIRMESPAGSDGLSAGWSFNVFCDGSSGGGRNSNGTNNTVNNISVGKAFTAASLGAYGVSVDAIEGTWVQPCSGGLFDPTQTAVYIQLFINGTSGPSDVYRMAEYLADGGTYADSPDIITPAGFCSTTNGTCAVLTFQSVPKYSCVGFEPPMNKAELPPALGGGPIARRVKKNRAFPFKATLVDADGNVVTDIVAAPLLEVSENDTPAVSVDITEDAFPNGKRTDGPEFFSAGDKWHYNLASRGFDEAGTYTGIMISGDDSEYVIDPTCEGLFVID